MRRVFLLLLGTLLTIYCIPSFAWALGEESFGNQPLNAANFRDWPGIVPVVNHENRVYHQWVNGNEHCFYRGNNASLNDVLQKFAATDEKVHEVVLRPGPGITHSFNKARTVDFNWNLHLVGGIAKSMTKKDQGAKIWSKHPMLTIYVGGDIELEKIKIPEGVTVIELADLEKRYSQGLKSTDRTVRGWGTGHLAQLDPYSKSNMEAVAKLLQDDDKWVRLNAAGALATFGMKAEPLIPTLRKALNTDDKPLQTRIQETIKKIELAKDKTKGEKEHQEILAKISQFRKTLAR
ncbi:HEAT repeat domain-containing protein [uncultured Gimesia sp.]|uniref:HEAT repeat domain-containing protein n=1 Tax=uncultured Gimesia sp. TaxID=1678688 RepID=UPI00261646E6|nr:HEAT repeat domain-containing protein [uncultured Gimesia sp.]